MPERLRHEFVEHLPEELEEGILYLALRYGTVAHKCFCGCRSEVVTPLSPTDWKLIYDGESVSLDPSIGNWSLPCRSHYWIKKSNVIWEKAWSPGEIAAGRAADRQVKAQQYAESAKPAGRGSWWTTFKRWWP
jgi:hypothetical protein